MYELYDLFNESIISRHRTAYNAGKAARKYAAAVYKNSSANYVPIGIRKGGERCDEPTVDEYYRGLNGE